MEITVQEVKKKLDQKIDFVLIDVRQQREFDFANIKGSTLIPLDKLGANSPLPIEKDKEIITYCHHGMRSLKAAHILLELGYKNVKSMTGGIDEWSHRIDSSVPTY